MSRSNPLHISIPKPCNENWDLMTPENVGRFCSNCHKTVIDFSHLSDTELYNYLTTVKTIPCGRFHRTQLNRPINHSIRKKNIWINFYRPIAAALAFFTIKNSAAANSRKDIPTTFSPSWKSPLTLKSTEEKIIISGIVKDMFQKPIENAEVSVNNVIVAKSDKDGNYQFEFNENKTESFLLIISYPDLVSAVRNYHPVMLSTTFNVTLPVPNKDGGFFMMGMPAYHSDMPVSAVCFKNNKKDLSNDAKTVLATVATTMKNFPGLSVKIVSYSPSIKLNTLRQDVVINYFINQQGISQDRFVLTNDTKSKKEMINILEIAPIEQQ